MKPGDVAFFTNLTIHASKENRSDRVRWSLDFRYHAAAETLRRRPRSGAPPTSGT